MWRLFFKLFGFKVVMTYDFDMDTRYRFVHRDLFNGGYRVQGLGRSWFHLNDNGTCSSPTRTYLERWEYV